ncbi:hypothetical protein GHV40_10200 [Devosia sp. D6-9]|nr:hypothetical protein GHV40_10200 [Devosia sp. D6-9]
MKTNQAKAPFTTNPSTHMMLTEEASMIERPKLLTGQIQDKVEIAVGDLHRAHDQTDYVTQYLADFIRRKVHEHGFESLDEAAEKSKDLCDLLFLLGEIEEVASALAQSVEVTMIRGQLVPEPKA